MKTTREELIDFLYWREKEIHPADAHNLVDKYLKSINSASNECLSVTENKAQRKVCRKCGCNMLEVTGESDFCLNCNYKIYNK